MKRLWVVYKAPVLAYTQNLCKGRGLLLS